MDVLTLGSKNYVKASVIARDLGYTADYVGQLCRSGKIDAKLVGRSWYVNRDSIHDHKKTRYRSNTQKTLDDLKLSIRTEESEPVQVSNFYTHHQPKRAAYAADETDLFPQTTKHAKSGSLKVSLADSHEISVQEEGDEYIFSKPDLPEVRFSGTLRVQEYEAADPLVEQGGRLMHPKEVENIKKKKIPKNIDISAKHDVETDAEHEVSDGGRLTFADKLAAIEEDKKEQEEPLSQKVASHTDGNVGSVREEEAPLGLFWTMLPILCLLFGLCCALCVYSFETDLSVIAGRQESGYRLDAHRFGSDAMHFFNEMKVRFITKK